MPGYPPKLEAVIDAVTKYIRKYFKKYMKIELGLNRRIAFFLVPTMSFTLDAVLILEIMIKDYFINLPSTSEIPSKTFLKYKSSVSSHELLN